MAQDIPTSEELRAYGKLLTPFCLFLVHGGACDPLVVSEGFRRLFDARQGYFEDLDVKTLKRHLHPDDLARFHSDIESARLDPDGRYSAVYRVRRNEAEAYRWISGKGCIERIDDGSHLLYVCFSDVQDKVELDLEMTADRLKQDVLLSNILSTTKTSIFWKDAERRFLGANRAFLDYYGFSDESEILGKNDEDMGWHTDPGPFRDDELRVLEEGITTSRVPGRCIARGEERNIVASKSPLIIDGRTVGLVGSFEDVTDEFRQQEEIRRLNSRLERSIAEHDQLMSTSQVCIVKVDLDGFTLVEYNDAMCRMIGLTRDEYEARFHHDMKLFFADGYEAVLGDLRQAIETALADGSESFTLSLPLPTRDGERWIGGAASFSEIDPTTGRPRYMVAIYRDTTDIYEAQQKLAQARIEEQRTALMREQLEKMRLMLDSVPSGLAALHIVGGVPQGALQLNRYFTERVDLPVDEDARADLHRFTDCLHPDDRARCREDFEAFLHDGSRTPVQYRFHSVKGHYYWGSVRGTIVHTDDDDEMAYFIYTDVDETRKAEMRLRKSREIYERTVNALQAAIWTYDIPNRRIQMGDNAATETLRRKYGWPKTFENVPESLLDTIEETDREGYLAMFREIEAGHDTSCDVWYRQRIGVEPHCERESYHVVVDDTGRPVRAYGVGINVTAEKKVDERYARELEYLRNNSDESLIAKGHYDLTQDTVLEYESRLGKKIYTTEAGVSYVEAYERFRDMSYSEEDRDIITEKLERGNLIRRYQSGETQTTLRYRRAIEGQDPIWVSMTVHTYMKPENGDLELFSYAYDITRRKRIETVMQLVSQSAFDYIGLIYVPACSFEILEKPNDNELSDIEHRVPYDEGKAFVDSSFTDQTQRRDFDEAIALDRIVHELRTSQHYTATYFRTEGARTYCKKLDYLWFDEQAQTILVICSDVTTSFERDQRQIARIEAAKLEAEQANEAKSTFLSSMSHDLRTPLSGVLGFTDLALKEPRTEKKQEYLLKIDSSGKLLLDLINDTLELSRIESGKMTVDPEAVSPADLVPAIVTALKPSAELKGIRLEMDAPTDDGAPLWCDRLKVQKIALNLISNAIKYTPEGGTVSVRLTPADQCEQDSPWVLHVDDDGIGMSREFMERMFEPFAQEQRSESVKTPGTGLGLAIVRRYVDLMGGTIEVHSELHEGTRWTISLPIHKASAASVHEPAKKSAATSLSGRRVLLCEDNYMNTEIAVMLLKDKGIEVETAENGSVGIDLFTQSTSGYFDAILMDFRMPVMDGLSAARMIRTLDRPDAKTVPIIAMTADAFEENIREAKDAGMNGYVTKPIEPGKLFDVLQECMAGESLL